MRKLYTALFAFAVLALYVAPSPARQALKKPPKQPGLSATSFTLTNGLKVILHEDHSSPTVMVYVWYHIGSKDEKQGKTGFAHLFEHLMFKGSKHVKDGQFDRLLEAAGGWNNGTTNADRTNYFEQVPANFLGLALYLEADRMAGLWSAMNQKVLDNQRDVVKNERRQSYENTPYGKAELAIQQSLWPKGHGNYNLTIGTMADLSAASLKDVEQFYRANYVPNNATLVIAGDLNVAATKKLVQKYFGWIPRKPNPPHVTLTKPVTPRAGQVKLIEYDQVQVPKVVLAWRSPTPFTRGDTTLELAAHILAGGKTSRLHRRLVIKERKAANVYAYQNAQMLGGEFQIASLARGKTTPDALFKAIDEEVVKLGKTKVSNDELLRAKRTFEAYKLKRLESLSARAGLLAMYSAYLGRIDHFSKDLAMLRSISADDIQRAVAKWLRKDSKVVMYVLPKKKSKKSAKGGAK